MRPVSTEHRYRLSGLVAGAISVFLLAACGGGSGDLLAIEVTGAPGGGQRITVASDGRARCNGPDLKQISSEQVIDAREIEREVYGLARDGESFEADARGSRRYSLRTDDGSVRWAEGASGLPKVLARTQLFALQLGRRLC